jgi:hypothetical protein
MILTLMKPQIPRNISKPHSLRFPGSENPMLVIAADDTPETITVHMAK